jgi:hypothetical protein
MGGEDHVVRENFLLVVVQGNVETGKKTRYGI